MDTDQLLLVEGKDEVRLFNPLIQHHFPQTWRSIQVLAVGGKDQFSAEIDALRVAIDARSSFQCMGIIRDADDNPKGAFRSVCDNLRKVTFEPPSQPGEFSNASPAVGVFIVPCGIAKHGALETLCRDSVQGSEAARCAELYLDCLRRNNALESKNEDKSFTHAYLAAMPDPVARVGEGAEQGVWDFDSPVFDDLVSFLRSFPLLQQQE